MDRLAGPVPLCARKVGPPAAVEGRHRQNLRRRAGGAALVLVFGSLVVIFGYFWVSESLWSGQTIGKKAFRLRAVGDRGEPLTFAQAGIRNIVRIVDFLPYAYGVGLIVLFANGKGKRLGDLAAGTVVVKDSDHGWLVHLPGARYLPAPPAPP